MITTQNALETIDFVIPWVDGSDPKWREERAHYQLSEEGACNSEVRFRDWSNLKYWFRGIEEHAPWVNRIHFITWGHFPRWLNVDHPKLHVVNHEDYIPAKYLPTFNSHTIELNIHRIPGLSEQFVYFNDDVFLTKKTRPKDFFRSSLPCDTFALNCIFFGHDSIGHIHGSDVEIINKYFDKRVLEKILWRKWFHPQNGFKSIVRTGLLMPWPWFPGFYYSHLANAYKKSTFEHVWEREEKRLNATCCCKFRENDNLNQWVFKFWQLACGEFHPRSTKFGFCFHLKDSNYVEACDCIRNSKYQLLCLNDTANTTQFKKIKKEILMAFEERFPRKSSFEL